MKTEDDPLLEDAPGPFGAASEPPEMEAMVLGADGLEGLVLRYGFFYGPGTHYGEDGAIVADVRRRRLAVVGKGTGVFSFIHVDDAADATVAAVERGAPASTTSPTTSRPDERVGPGARRGRRREAPVARAALAGKAGRRQAGGRLRLELRGASNEKAKRELGWQPAHPSWRTGFAESLLIGGPSLARSNTRSAGRSSRRGSAGRRRPGSVRDLNRWPSVPIRKPSPSSTIRNVGETRNSPDGSGPSSGTEEIRHREDEGGAHGGESILRGG